MTPWLHQARGVADTLAAIRKGKRRICLTAPTGAGKTWMMQALAQHFLEQPERVVLYTNRKLLVDQTSSVLAAAGLDHGIRAAGYGSDLDALFQVCSMQTENSRSLQKKTWKLHDAALVLIDEAHLQKGKVAREIMRQHLIADATIVGFTATPVDIGDLYETMVVAGTNSELRHCGALVPAYHYGPDEPDLRFIKKLPALGEDLSETQVRSLMGKVMDGKGNKRLNQLFGRVFEWWNRLNPGQKPTILFAPGVAESIWFAQEFTRRGIPSAHIDGEEVWVNDEFQRTSREARQEILEKSRTGAIKVLCNRFVLREGIDAPWLAHGILATVFGGLQSYLQSGGRLLRAYPGMATITITDHGGNWWRHGSLNADREWDLNWSASMIAGMREDNLRQKKEVEPFRCPQCGMILAVINCPCGFTIQPGMKSRPVVQSDGILQEMTGDIFKPRRTYQKPDGETIWKKMYYRSSTERGARTFRAAAALFAYENDWAWPKRNWPLMPKKDLDWFKLVKDVPREHLTSSNGDD